jgi:hypothetical protein
MSSVRGVIMGLDYIPRMSVFGLVTGTTSGVQFPDQPCYMFRVKAGEDNSDTVFIGGSVNTCTYPLGAGDETGWVEAENLNSLYYRVATGTNYVHWWVQR